jgi:lipopolysaccharide export system permease protein
VPILQVYVLRQLCVAFAFAVSGMLFVALPGIAVAASHRLAGVETGAILLFIPLLMLGLVPYILPLGFLLGVVVTYGRLAADNEWTAIRMTGANPLRMCLAPMLLAVLCSFGTEWLIGTKLPEVKTDQKRYSIDALRDTIANLSPGRTELHLGEFYLQSQYRADNDFINTLIHIPREKGSLTVLAQRVGISIDGNVMLIRMSGARIAHGSVSFASENPEVRLDLDKLIKTERRGLSGTRYRKTSELRAALAAGEYGEELQGKVRYEIHQRYAMSSTFVMFLLLGIPTGLLLRKGTQLAALSVAVGYALLYYVLSLRLTEDLAGMDLIPPELGAWSVNIVGALAGLWLLRKALRQ